MLRWCYSLSWPPSTSILYGRKRRRSEKSRARELQVQSWLTGWLCVPFDISRNRTTFAHHQSQLKHTQSVEEAAESQAVAVSDSKRPQFSQHKICDGPCPLFSGSRRRCCCCRRGKLCDCVLCSGRAGRGRGPRATRENM